MAKKAKKNYVNNKDLYIALSNYLEKVKEAEAAGLEKPVVPDYIGKCIYDISSRLSTKPNFSGYTFRDDMIMDGIENCLQYMHNFNPEKTQNPFAYFSKIVWNAFLRRIAMEKKQMYVKYKSSQEMISAGGTYTGGTEDLSVHLNTSADYINDFIRDYEEKNEKKKQGGQQ